MQRFFRGAVAAEILHAPDHADDRARPVDQRPGGDLHRDRAAVAVQPLGLVALDALAGQGATEVLRRGLVLTLGSEGRDRTSDDLAAGIAEQGLGGAVPARDAAPGIDAKDRNSKRFHDMPKAVGIEGA